MSSKFSPLIAYALAAVAFTGTSAFAQDASSGTASLFSAAPGERAVSVQGSFPHGASVSVSQKVAPAIDVRLILNPPQTLKKFKLDSGGFAIEAKPKLSYYGIFGDWYIKESAWRLTAGLAATSQSKIAISAAKSTNAIVASKSNGNGLDIVVGDKTYTVDAGQTYTTADGKTWKMRADGVVINDKDNATISINDVNQAVNTARLKTEVRWPSVMPYIGVGYNSNSGKDVGWAFIVDVGIFIGRPKVKNTVFSNDCSSNSCSVVNQELNRQSQEATDKLSKEVRKLGILPKITIGVEYRF